MNNFVLNGHREPSSAAGWRLEDSAEEPQCAAQSMVKNPAGRRKNLHDEVNGWQQLDALEVTASGRRDC